MFILWQSEAQFRLRLFTKIIGYSFSVCLLTSFGFGYAHAESLSFDAALTLAEQDSPDLAAQTAAVEAARLSAVAAGRWPDPKLNVGIENLPIEGTDQWSLTNDFMTMSKIGLMQEVPNGAKRRAQVEVATAGVDLAAAERRLKVLLVRRDTALAWLDRYYLERRVALFDELDRENRIFADAVQAQLAGGKGMPADVVIPKQEAADLADRRDELMAAIAKSKAALQRFVSSAGDEPLTDAAPALTIDAMQLRTQVYEHPELAVFVPRVEIAQAEIDEAKAMKHPDWGIELAYLERGSEFSDMVSLQFTLGLPLFTKYRQQPQIAAKRHALNEVNAEREVMLRDHTQELEIQLVDYETLTRQLARVQEIALPLAQQKVDYQLASYRAGKSDLTAVLAARRELITERLRQLDLESQRVAIAVKLYFVYGEGVQ